MTRLGGGDAERRRGERDEETGATLDTVMKRVIGDVSSQLSARRRLQAVLLR